MKIRKLAAALAATAACIAALTAAQPAVARGGGGGHVVMVPIYIPGRGGLLPYVQAPTVDMPLDITDAAVDRTTGVVALHDVIALHTVRAADAIVLDEPAQGPNRTIPAGTALAHMVMYEAGKPFDLWCDMSAFDGAFLGVTYQCLSDPDHAGAVTQNWTATTNDAFLGYGGLESVRWRAVMPAARYHKATPEQRPTGVIGYAWCGGDGVRTPPRFEVSGKFAAGAWTTSRTHACAFGTWPDAADHSTVLVDNLKVHLTPGAKSDSLNYKVEDRIPAMALARLAPGGGLRSRADAAAEAQADNLVLNTPVIIPTGRAAIVADGGVGVGDTMFSIEARHGSEGVLAKDMWMGAYKMFGRAAPPDRPALNAGTPVYAVHLKTTDSGMQVVWCAPLGQFAACFPSDGVGPIWSEERPTMLVSDMIMHSGGQPDYVTPPVVRRDANAMAPMRISYVFQGWTGAGLAKVAVRINEQIVRTYVSLPQGEATRASIMPVLGGYLIVQPDPLAPIAARVEFKPAG